MKTTLIAISAALTLAAAPALAEDSVQITTTKSTQESLAVGAAGSAGAAAAAIGALIIIGIIAGSDDDVAGTTL